MIERLNSIEERYNQISKDLLSPENITDIKKMTELSKEQSSLSETYETCQEYKQVLEDISAAKEMLKDNDMVDFAKEELSNLENKKSELEARFEILLLPKDPNDEKNVIVEIRGAAGGDEGNIFAGDLFDMYKHYSEKQGWHIEINEEYPSEAGGYSLISFTVKGNCVYSKLKYESGAHRVQRVPATETQGRVHTSTATVLVMPEAEDFDFELDMNEVRIDITRSSGCGGQGVNTTDSAVRLTHIPTGIVISCQDEKSQLKNKDKALKVLRARLYELECQKKQDAESEARRSQIGTGDRSEKIRTYNFPQGRVTDHRIKFTTHRLENVMNGDLDEIIDNCVAADQAAKLAQVED